MVGHTCILGFDGDEKFHLGLQISLCLLLFFPRVDLSLDFGIVILIALAEDAINKNKSLHAPINFPKTVHIHLPDKRPPLAMSKIPGEEFGHKFIIVMYMHFNSIFGE